MAGPPKAPKSAPVPVVQFPGSSLPACERSMVGPPEMLMVVALVELTWMLREGPPQILTTGFPFNDNAPESVGCRTRIGIGETMSTMAAVASARIDAEPGATKRMSPTEMVRVILTRTRFGVSTAERATPGALSGKSTVTWSMDVDPTPFWRAK